MHTGTQMNTDICPIFLSGIFFFFSIKKIMVLSTTDCVICYQRHQPNMDNIMQKTTTTEQCAQANKLKNDS